jgi:hypothetical protein
MVWLQVGSDRYVLGLAPQQLAHVTRAQAAKLVLEDGTAGIADRGRG